MTFSLLRLLSALSLVAVSCGAAFGFWVVGDVEPHSTALAIEEEAPAFFRIKVVDDQTQRGVPMVEFRMVDGTKYYTDSAGVIAFYEPGLMNTEVFFFIESHGYEYPADYFGYRGVKLNITEGGFAIVQLPRVNIAERLYRITGAGIYRDSRLLGDSVPIAKPFINGLVAGQDSALAVEHNDKLYWIWGDTNRPSYPLGNFKASGATSELPGNGGLDPADGIDLTYWVDANGFSREMAPVAGTGVVWLGGMQTAPDASGAERLFAHFTRLAGLGSPIEQGLVLWNESTEVFEEVSNIPLGETLHPHGSAPFRHIDGGVEYFYFANPLPNLRVKAELALMDQPDKFEGYTPMVAGSRFNGAATQLERDPVSGALIWGWKANTPPISHNEQDQLITAGLMTRLESPYRLKDFDTGNKLIEHNGTVAWNDYRQKWIMVFGVSFGSSFLGEIYIAESDSIEGPWVFARKIVTHKEYSFYNVAQRSFFDQGGGRIIYFEGTYTMMFSGSEIPTPRYNYNQIMYRLDLSNPDLTQP